MKETTHTESFLSLEEWMLARLKDKTEEQVLRILRLLPDPIKEKYRELWKKEKSSIKTQP